MTRVALADSTAVSVTRPGLSRYGRVVVSSFSSRPPIIPERAL